MMTTRTVLRGGRVVGKGGSTEADLAIVDGTIEHVGDVPTGPDDQEVDCSGRLIMPGLVDGHTHADGRVFDDEVAFALLRQGVTTVIAGQDGVSYAPGDGSYATRYFAAINGAHPTYDGGGVAALLAGYDQATPINVGYLVPAGTVREQVLGLRPGRPAPDELIAMRDLVAQGMAAGALGLSTGLDYTPGLFADADELAELCRPVAEAGGVYVSHLRGYEEDSPAGLAELIKICEASGARGHVSHFHARPELMFELLGEATARIDLTFDWYPYSRGCSVLGMVLLPPELLAEGFDAATAALSTQAGRTAVIESWLPRLVAKEHLGATWADKLALAHIAAPQYGWAHGLTLAEAARRAEAEPMDLGLRMLAAADLEVSVVMRTQFDRGDDELARILPHPAQLTGSDGIFIGRSTHPRGWGTFARLMDVFVRQRGDLGWPELAEHSSALPVRTFRLGRRGELRRGAVADLFLLDPARIRDNATYPAPRRPADGVDDVWVAGERVLADGQLTGIRSGRGLRRG